MSSVIAIPEKSSLTNWKKRSHRDIAKYTRDFLESTANEALDAKGNNRLQQIFQRVFKIAMNVRDPRCLAANQWLIERGYGKIKPSEDELDAMRQGGVQIVIVDRPDVPLRTEPVPQPQPKFIEGEFRDGE